jgi:peptidoglycan/LPS O-acetylase OafA/YrhL
MDADSSALLRRHAGRNCAAGGGLLGIPINGIERNILFIQTIPTGAYRWFGVSWSLSIEEWSYVLIPCMAGLLWFLRRLDTRFVVIFTAAIVVMTIYRLSLGSTGVTFDTDIRRALIPRLDALAYGGLMRVLWMRYRNALHEARFRLFGIFILGQFVCLQLLFTYGVRNSFVAAGLLTLLPATFCLCFPVALAIDRVSKSVRRVSYFVASRSYALYLFHFVIFSLVSCFLPAAAFPAKVAIAVGVAFVIADFAFRWIEKPYMDRRPAEPRMGTPETNPAIA